MANKSPWIRNLNGAQSPLILLGKFAAGSSQTIDRGDILELTGATNTEFVPIDSDFSMDNDIAIANEQIKSGDRAGYYEVIVPRPGDVFEFELSAAASPAIGDAVYYNAAQKVATSGSNILGRVVGQDHYPLKQGHLADDAGADAGTTIRSTSFVQVLIDEAASFWGLLQV